MHKLLFFIFNFSFLIGAGGGGPVSQDSGSLLMIFKEFVNVVSEPIISFTLLTVVFPFLFPPTDWFDKIHRKLGLHYMWTNPGGYVLFIITTVFFYLGYNDPYFSIILNKPDNFPIVLMAYSMLFVIWYSMKKAYINDARLEEGKKPREYNDPEDKVLVWPDLVYIEFICLLIFMAFLTMMTPASLFLKAQISLLEHNASKNLLIAGEKLANGQTARLLGPKEIDDPQQIILSNTSISVLCLILFILSLLPIFFLNKLLVIFTSICFILLIIPIVNIGYAVTIPFYFLELLYSL